MKKLIISLLTTAVISSSVSVYAADKTPARERLDDRVQEVNRSAKQQGKSITEHRIATETGVSLEQVQSLHKRYDDIGPAGLMIACVLANETKKDPEDFMKKRSGGKTWAEIARDNNVSLDKLSARLDRLDAAIGEPEKGGKAKNKSK